MNKRTVNVKLFKQLLQASDRAEVCWKAGVSYSSVDKLVNGRNSSYPKETTCINLARELKVSVDELFPKEKVCFACRK